MTREFNKQRNDPRPPLRNTSSTRNGEERSPVPARPRLNRASVDRAWETGASHHHADYRPRSNNGQAPRNNWDGQRSERSNPQGRSGGSRPYGEWDQSRRPERASNRNEGPRSRSFNSERRNADDQRFGNRRDYSDGSNDRSAQRGPRNYSERPDPRSAHRSSRNYADRPDDRGAQRGPRNYSEGPDRKGTSQTSRSYGSRGRNPQFRDQESTYRDYKAGRDARPAQKFGGKRNTTPDFERRSGPFREGQRRPEENPRWQSRPWAQREHGSNEQQRKPRRHQPASAQFEGDYEHFTNFENEHPAANDRSFDYNLPDSQVNVTEERHVTRLPDGRVLKGPRPAQRQNARFWTDIENDTQDLVKHVQPVDRNGRSEGETTEEATAEQPAVLPKKSGKRASGEKKAAKSGSLSLKPSQRGFKWPNP